MLKKIIITLIVVLFSLPLFSCNLNIEEVYSKIEIGKNFGSNIDGYQKKLPYNFCLDVDLGYRTRLFRVPDELLNVPYFSNSVYNTPAIIEGRYIKGYYDDERLVLCEELSTDKFEYIVFEFSTQKITRFVNEEELSQFQIDKWFSLCNTTREIIK